MIIPESTPRLEDLIGEADIHDLIDHHLTPAPYEGRATEKYWVDGLPEVVIRHTHQVPEPEEHLIVAFAYNELPSYGIDALPYISIPHDDEIYVVTRKMHGVNLEDLLHPDAPGELATAVDQRWANIINYIRGARRVGRPCATDIIGPNQYMLGRTVSDVEEKLKLVDLGTYAADYADSPENGIYEHRLLSAANAIVEIEQALMTRRLVVARAALSEAVAHAYTYITAVDDPYRRAVLRVSDYVVEQGIEVAEDNEKFIHTFMDD